MNLQSQNETCKMNEYSEDGKPSRLSSQNNKDADYVAGSYDVIVVGAGHAGCEAALASARLGCRTLIITLNLDSIANMPCNPNIGGTAKGQLVREIDALGGQMGLTADETMIQMRILNRAKGPAVYSQRAQIDRQAYHVAMKRTLEAQESLDLRQAEVTELLFSTAACSASRQAMVQQEQAAVNTPLVKKIRGVRTKTGSIFLAKALILTTGTYLRGRIILGDLSYAGGPDGLPAAEVLSEGLLLAGIQLMRFKTGTPARVHRRNIDFSRMEIQPGDEPFLPFSYLNSYFPLVQVPCHLTHSTLETREVVQKNLHRSPLFSGKIEGTGPRYCPSFEDKIVRFKDRETHQIFVEPMGRNTQEMYLQGFSSSMPEEVQAAMIRTVPGLENASIMRPAYAIEYDCVDPMQLHSTLEFRSIPDVYSAGQCNGSSGYEEAAAQGLIAGVNAARKILGKGPLVIDRSQGYIGVLIDDLVTKGTQEPYRMMTSRAEYRLHLRQDNADLRLTELGWQAGLVSSERYEIFLRRKLLIETENLRLQRTVLTPTEKLNEFLTGANSATVQTGIRISDLLRRPEITYASLAEVDSDRPLLPEDVTEQVSIAVKYSGYLERQMQQIAQFKRAEESRLPQDVDWRDVSGLSLEARQKLCKHMPESLGQASRISGISPADISVLQIWLEAERRRGKKE